MEIGADIGSLAGLIPQPAIAAPMVEKTSAAIGASARFALEDHQHPRLTSTTYATLGADGTATVPFTRVFTAKPGFSITEIDATGNQPLVCVVQAFQQDAQGRYTGCTIKGYRSQVLPALAPVSTLALLSGAIGGINATNTALSNLNIFGGSAANASVSVVAIARSDV